MADWYRNKWKKTAHLVKVPQIEDKIWVQMKCGYYTYPDILEKDNDAPRCKKCEKGGIHDVNKTSRTRNRFIGEPKTSSALRRNTQSV